MQRRRCPNSGSVMRQRRITEPELGHRTQSAGMVGWIRQIILEDHSHVLQAKSSRYHPPPPSGLQRAAFVIVIRLSRLSHTERHVIDFQAVLE